MRKPKNTIRRRERILPYSALIHAGLLLTKPRLRRRCASSHGCKWRLIRLMIIVYQLWVERRRRFLHESDFHHLTGIRGNFCNFSTSSYQSLMWLEGKAHVHWLCSLDVTDRWGNSLLSILLKRILHSVRIKKYIIHKSNVFTYAFFGRNRTSNP